ncbi:hypothetical protein OROGR_007590 [Orobanche gracilis]
MILRLGSKDGEGLKSLKARFRVAIVVIIFAWIGLAGLYVLLTPISNGCVMTYMYPTYIPISTPENVSSVKYGVHFYHEGWRKIDFNNHLRQLSGVPVLFIPGNGGSYKQVRSLGAESDRAYQGGPLEWDSYQASPILGEGLDIDFSDILLPRQYTSKLDWFAVDLEGEHSAMDGRILQEHAEYVVYAIHRVSFPSLLHGIVTRILDHYKESLDAQAKEGAPVSGSLPESVILVGHSMGGFIARAAVVHPHLRKFAVETVLTLSTPHQSPPVALQPSLGHYYAHVNQAWRKGYEVQISRGGHYLSDPLLLHVVVVSISGGYNDYQCCIYSQCHFDLISPQNSMICSLKGINRLASSYRVRTELESLDGIVPPTHGFMISSTSVRNVWLSMEHQIIAWCNQLVVQVSHTLLSLIDAKTGHPYSDVRQRIGIFTKMLHSGIPENFFSLRQLQQPQMSDHLSNGKVNSGLQVPYLSASPCKSQWSEDGRWMDIQELGTDGKKHFVFVTNLSPCSGVRLHLWREKGTSAEEFETKKQVVEVTSKMVHIPSGPAPRQIEPGSQSEQAPPSAVFWLGPRDMHGFRFLTISVAPRPTVSGRPPPAVSMGIGQFFNPNDGDQVFSFYQLIHSLYSEKVVNLKEDHPLVLNLTFSVSLGLFPVALSLKTTGCGIKKSEFPVEESGDVETSTICRRRCFPPVALAWDATSGLHIFPNSYSQRIVVDSSPALWTSSQESDKTTVLLLVDPHCSYRTTVYVSITAAAGRFLLLYFPQISGLCFAVVFFALMRQACAWELDQAIPSVLSSVESNLRTKPFFFLATSPILSAMLFSCLSSQSLLPNISFLVVSIVSYVFANGAVVVLILLSQMLFYVAGTFHVFVKKWWYLCEGNFCFSFVQRFINISSSFASTKVVRMLRVNSMRITSLVSIALVCLVHPALGFFVFLVSHALCCHSALSSHVGTKDFCESRNEVNSGSILCNSKYGGDISKLFPENETCNGSPESGRNYVDTQLELFHHRHGLLVLHFLAALMFVPSLVAWLQSNWNWSKFSMVLGFCSLHQCCAARNLWFKARVQFSFVLYPGHFVGN